MAAPKSHAPVKWAQRADSLYVTINLPDVTGEKLDLKEDRLLFSGSSEGTDYELDLVFMHEVDPEKSTWKVLPRSIQMNIFKKDTSEDAEPWIRLLKDKNQERGGQVTIDWNKWVDDDDEPESKGFDVTNLNGGSGFGGMPGMPGMPGMGGPAMGGPAMDNMTEMLKSYGKKEEEEYEEDSDDEIPPPPSPTFPPLPTIPTTTTQE